MARTGYTRRAIGRGFSGQYGWNEVRSGQTPALWYEREFGWTATERRFEAGGPSDFDLPPTFRAALGPLIRAFVDVEIAANGQPGPLAWLLRWVTTQTRRIGYDENGEPRAFWHDFFGPGELAVIARLYGDEEASRPAPRIRVEDAECDPEMLARAVAEPLAVLYERALEDERQDEQARRLSHFAERLDRGNVPAENDPRDQRIRELEQQIAAIQLAQGGRAEPEAGAGAFGPARGF